MKFAVLAAVMLSGLTIGPMFAETRSPQGAKPSVRSAQAVVTPEGKQRVQQLTSVMQIAQVLSVMRLEGFDYSKTLEDDMFPGRGGADWSATVDSIYSESAMKSVFDAALADELAAVDPAAIEIMQAFFGSDRGQRILTLEIEARRALLDQDTENAAKLHVEDLAAANDPQLALIRDFAEINDLIEMNVAGALNANLAFFKGMAAGGGFKTEMTEDQMLQNVWSQESAIRTETETWLFPYLALAYQPLADDDLQAYLAFSDQAEGKQLNAAIFAAFNVLFTDISGQLGRAAAKQLHGEDI